MDGIFAFLFFSVLLTDTKPGCLEWRKRLLFHVLSATWSFCYCTSIYYKYLCMS